MFWFWVGFFSLVAVLLALDLGVLNRKAKEPTIKSAAYWTAGWVTLGLSFTGIVYLIYENGWLDATLIGKAPGGHGTEAAITYVSAYLLEQALSVDNIFVIALLFKSFRVPLRYQHRVLFWGILGAVVFRLIMLGGGAYLAHRFGWIFYIFGAYLVFQGLKLFKHDEDADEDTNNSFAVRALRKFVRIQDGDFGGKFTVMIDGRRALTTVAVCLISIELTDIVFALDSIPAVLSVSQETFIMVTSNIFAIMGLRSLYFVLAGAMAEFRYLKMALAVLLIFIGVKMILHSYIHISHVISLAAIAGIIGIGVLASIVASRREEKAAASLTNVPAPPESGPPEP
ncbi:MAG: TerC/Alx family metal homeostasis membrane protein [Kofleriaceae bacterium]